MVTLEEPLIALQEKNFSPRRAIATGVVREEKIKFASKLGLECAR